MEFEVELETKSDFTRCSIVDTGGQREEISVKTAPDSLASLIECIEKGAKGFGYAAGELLKKTRSVKLLAPEMITDTLENKRGAQTGLVVSKGHKKEAYFQGAGENPLMDYIVNREMVVGIEEETNAGGEQVLKPREEELRDKVRSLLEFGTRIIVVSLRNAAVNSANERLVKEAIASDYPRHYLGAVPVLLCSEFSDEKDDFLRTGIGLLNAYAWFEIDVFLRRVETFLQQHGYNFNLWVTQADGGAAPTHRVTPLKTCTSDPVALLRSVCKLFANP